MDINEVEAYLEGKGIRESDLTGKAKEAFEMYKASKEIFEEDTSDNSMKVQFVQASKTAIMIIEAMLADKQKASGARKKVAQKKTIQRKKSIGVVEEVKKEVPNLEYCLQKAKEHQKKVRASKPPPKQKTRVTKVKESFARILKLMPSEKTKDIEASEQALRDCATKLFKINGMNQLEFVEKELKEVKDKRTPEAEKEKKKAA